jgi:prolyl 4-hydroxylase
VAAWLRAAETRLAQQSDIRTQCLEPWQMTRYRRGTSYDYHLDCGAWARHPSGERQRTVMLVIQAPRQGGATHFRALARTVRPIVGRLVVWRNLLPNGDCDHAMIHSGRPVWQGCKTILTTWERQRPYVEATT